MTTGSASPPTSPLETNAQAPERDYLVRSEEQLQIKTDRIITGYARLEKFTVTESKTITVEVTHEEVRLVHRDTDGPAADPAGPVGSNPTDADRWVVVSREEVVVSKKIVPLERVRLEVYPVVEQRQVTEQVRKEQIDAAPDIV